MPSYPSQLPLPMQDGYALQHQSPFTRTEMQSGRARQRRTFTSVPSSASVTWFFTSDVQCQLFEGWFRDDLGAKDGENWFDMPLQTPLGVYQYQCRFVDMYQGPSLAAFNKWQITASLEIRERPILPVDYATLMPEYVLLSDIFDIAMNQEWPAA
jgi:hypothetical protein